MVCPPPLPWPRAYPHHRRRAGGMGDEEPGRVGAGKERQKHYQGGCRRGNGAGRCWRSRARVFQRCSKRQRTGGHDQRVRRERWLRGHLPGGHLGVRLLLYKRRVDTARLLLLLPLEGKTAGVIWSPEGSGAAARVSEGSPKACRNRPAKSTASTLRRGRRTFVFVDRKPGGAEPPAARRARLTAAASDERETGGIIKLHSI